MKASKLSFLLLTFFAFACARGLKIQTDNISPANFNAYQSFMFFNPKNIPASNFSFSQENQSTLFDAVAFELKAKGYKSVGEADMLIKIQGGTSLESERRNSNFNDPMFYRPGMSPMYRPNYRAFDDITNKYTTIIIDILDPKTNKLLWQGVATGILAKKKDNVEMKLREAIKDIFEEYPYTAL